MAGKSAGTVSPKKTRATADTHPDSARDCRDTHGPNYDALVRPDCHAHPGGILPYKYHDAYDHANHLENGSSRDPTHDRTKVGPIILGNRRKHEYNSLVALIMDHFDRHRATWLNLDSLSPKAEAPVNALRRAIIEYVDQKRGPEWNFRELPRYVVVALETFIHVSHSCWMKLPDQSSGVGNGEDDRPVTRSSKRKRINLASGNDGDEKAETDGGVVEDIAEEEEGAFAVVTPQGDVPRLGRPRVRRMPPNLQSQTGQVVHEFGGAPPTLTHVCGRPQHVATDLSDADINLHLEHVNHRAHFLPAEPLSDTIKWGGSARESSQDRAKALANGSLRVCVRRPRFRSALAPNPFQTRDVLQARVAELELQNAALQHDNAILGIAIAENHNTTRNSRSALLKLFGTTRLPARVLARLLDNPDFLAKWPIDNSQGGN